VPREITTIAGNGTAGFSGDGGQAALAVLSGPTGIAVDASGNLYIADFGNDRIRKMSTAGVITTVAGNGTYAFSGDGGPATSAALWAPSAVAVDAAGNLYIADGLNYRVRKVSTSGTITTVAGNGTAGFLGDNGPATSAEFNWNAGGAALAVDSTGNIYIVDQNNKRIRKVDTTGVITTFVGGGTTTNILGQGQPAAPATSVTFQPSCVAVDTAGNVYTALNDILIQVTPGGSLRDVGGISGRGSIQGIAVDGNGNIYTEQYCVIYKGSTQIEGGTGNTTAGFSGDNGPATSAEIQSTYSQDVLTADSSGTVYIADQTNNRIRKIFSTSTYAP
jgi:sugar lactone lactonase YvrE